MPQCDAEAAQNTVPPILAAFKRPLMAAAVAATGGSGGKVQAPFQGFRWPEFNLRNVS